MRTDIVVGVVVIGGLGLFWWWMFQHGPGWLLHHMAGG
jgi:hypothetical protein